VKVYGPAKRLVLIDFLNENLTNTDVPDKISYGREHTLFIKINCLSETVFRTYLNNAQLINGKAKIPDLLMM